MPITLSPNGSPPATSGAVAVGAARDREGLLSTPSKTFRDDARFRILRLLEAHPERTQREISDALGISLGGVNYCLQGLVEKGNLKIRNFRTSQNKLAYAYLLTPKGLAEKARLTRGFLERRRAEYDALKQRNLAIETRFPDLKLAESPSEQIGAPT